MTPTLIGRWQTRLFLFATIGVLVTLAFLGLKIGDQPRSIYFWVLGYITCFGFFGTFSISKSNNFAGIEIGQVLFNY